MSTETKIEWADVTVNPIVGCSKCSPGCDNCYAERIAAMRVKHPNWKISDKYTGVVDAKGKWTGVIDFDVSCLVKLPRKPKRIFVGSMCDLFHDSVMDYQLEHIFGHIGLTRANSHHTFMILTKRPERMRDVFMNWKPFRTISNVWLGVTVCNQTEADAKIPVLLQTPAAKRFVSVEPMLGPVSLTRIPWIGLGSTAEKDALTGEVWIPGNCGESSQTLQGKRLDWAICGGETGPQARPMYPAWVRSLRDQCDSANVPFFFKSWGEWTPGFSLSDGSYMVNADVTLPRRADCYYLRDDDRFRMLRVGKRRSGRLLDDREWNEVPS